MMVSSLMVSSSSVSCRREPLGAVESALERVEDAVYGKCTECSGVISKTRLKAIPYTPLCIKCAEAQERV